MTTRTAIAAKVTELLQAGAWQAVSTHQGLLSIRWSQDDLPTPAPLREGRGAPYPFETYHRLVILTFLDRKIVMRVCVAPWVPCSDTTPPLWLVEAILADVELAFNTARQRALRRERHAAAERSARARGARS